MKKKIKAFKVISLIFFFITIALLVFAIPIHIQDYNAMQECSAIPDCKYIPIVTIIALIAYCISFALINISIIFCILYHTVKKREI